MSQRKGALVPPLQKGVAQRPNPAMFRASFGVWKRAPGGGTSLEE